MNTSSKYIAQFICGPVKPMKHQTVHYYPHLQRVLSWLYVPGNTVRSSIFSHVQAWPAIDTVCTHTPEAMSSVDMATVGEPRWARSLTCLTRSPARFGTVYGNLRQKKWWAYCWVTSLFSSFTFPPANQFTLNGKTPHDFHERALLCMRPTTRAEFLKPNFSHSVFIFTFSLCVCVEMYKIRMLKPLYAMWRINITFSVTCNLDACLNDSHSYLL